MTDSVALEVMETPAPPVQASTGLVVGRRPVFDNRFQIVGYKLAVVVPDADPPATTTMTEEVITRAALEEQGLTPFFSTKLAFIRPDRPYLLGHKELPLDAGGALVVVSGCDSADEQVVDGCRRLVDSGVRVAISEPHLLVPGAPLLELASFVRVDLDAPTGDGPPGLEELSAHGARLVAGRVDSMAQLQRARKAGFELFEGRLLSFPVAVITEALTPNRLTCLRMLEKVEDPDTSAADLERIVAADAGLSYRLLHVSGLGASGGLRRPVRSIREATVLLGREWIYRWLLLMLVADANQGAPEQLIIAMTRAKMCELMAGGSGRGERDAAFTVGLVSALELLLGAPLPEIVAKLAITPELVEALLHGRGPLGAVLADVLDWELGRPGKELRCGLAPVMAERCYLEALAWAGGLNNSLTTAAAAA